MNKKYDNGIATRTKIMYIEGNLAMRQENLIAVALFSIVILAIVPCVQCAEDDILFQVSTIDALLQGVFEGFFTVEDLKTHGDFGIGTFDSLD